MESSLFQLTVGKMLVRSIFQAVLRSQRMLASSAVFEFKFRKIAGSSSTFIIDGGNELRVKTAKPRPGTLTQSFAVREEVTLRSKTSWQACDVGG